MKKYHRGAAGRIPSRSAQDAPGASYSTMSKDYATVGMHLPERRLSPRRMERRAPGYDGFSLLELVVAVSIMLILGIVGFVAYQSYTDNARTATVKSAAQQVLTAVIAADDSTDNTAPEDVVGEYNRTTHDLVANIAEATDEHLVVTAEDAQGTVASVSVAGDYSHLEPTVYTEPGVHYAWTGNEHNSISVKYRNGEVVSQNLARNPRMVSISGSIPIVSQTEFAAWEDNSGAAIYPTNPVRGGRIFALDEPVSQDQYVAIAFDAQRVVPGGTLRVMMWNQDDSPTIGNAGVTRPSVGMERERITTVIRPQIDDAHWIYIEFLHNEAQANELVGYVDRLHVAVGDTEGEALEQVATYFDGNSM